MNALAWTILLLEAAPYLIGAGCVVVVVLIYRLWRMD